jgi:hypothetical protein
MRSGTRISLGVDGAIVSSVTLSAIGGPIQTGATNAVELMGVPAGVALGGQPQFMPPGVYMDDLRFTNGVCRYPATGTYTAPVATFPNSISATTATDSFPHIVANHFLTDPLAGAGFPVAHLGDWTQWSNYCLGAYFACSPAYTSQTQASQMLAELVQMTNSAAYWSEGFLKIVPFGDAALTSAYGSYTPAAAATTPIYYLTDDDYLGDANADPIIITRKQNTDAYNSVQIECLDRGNAYNPVVVQA